MYAPGAVLAGRYRLVRKLGQGGMGAVWLAEDTRLDARPTAIKTLPAVLAANKRSYRALKDEALLSLKLVHPNIVAMRDFEDNDGSPFLVMDYVDGRTLDDILDERGRLSEAEAFELLAPVARALDYAHKEGVIHRDIKPSNIIVRRDGRPFVLDFGIAREAKETMTRVTGMSVSGTLAYMSPEQLNGAAPAPAQDVYSFAATVYECLSGHPPFKRGDIQYQIMHTEPLAIDCAGGVMAALAKDPAKRPATCLRVLAGETKAEKKSAKAEEKIAKKSAKAEVKEILARKQRRGVEAARPKEPEKDDKEEQSIDPPWLIFLAMLGGTGYVAVRLFYAGHWLVGSFAALSAFIALAWGGVNRLCANKAAWYGLLLLHAAAGFFALREDSVPLVLPVALYAVLTYVQWKAVLKD